MWGAQCLLERRCWKFAAVGRCDLPPLSKPLLKKRVQISRIGDGSPCAARRTSGSHPRLVYVRERRGRTDACHDCRNTRQHCRSPAAKSVGGGWQPPEPRLVLRWRSARFRSRVRAPEGPDCACTVRSMVCILDVIECRRLESVIASIGHC